MRRFDDEDLTGAEFRECDLSRARLVGVVMQDAEIDGLVTNLVVNGVEVMPYVEAELDRRHPVRLLIRSDSPARRSIWVGKPLAVSRRCATDLSTNSAVPRPNYRRVRSVGLHGRSWPVVSTFIRARAA